MKRTLGTLLALLLLAGCGGPAGPSRPAAHSPSSSPSSSASSFGTGPAATPTAHRTAEQVVHDPRANLTGVRVHRDGDALVVATAWSACHGGRCRQAIAVSDDGFDSARYLRGTARTWRQHVATDLAPPTAAQLRAAKPLLPQPVPSLSGAGALVAGGDGATLLPFELAARSADGGATWTRFEVPRFEGDLPYVAGGVALPDGRLLVLLDHWSGDRAGKPDRQVHGLWVSDGDDWSTYEPAHPRFRPALSPEPRGGSPITGVTASTADALVTVTTWDGKVYVSADAARTFHEVAAR